MSTFDRLDGGAIEECVDELGDFILSLDRYPHEVLAVALRVHLEGILRTLLEQKVCTPAQARDFVRNLEREVLE